MDEQEKNVPETEVNPTVTPVVAGNPPYDTQPAGWEQWFDTTFNKKAPFQFPDNIKDWLANNSWWLVLVGAGLSVLGILGAYSSLNMADKMITSYGLRSEVGMAVNANAVYLSILASIVSAVLLFMASSKLKLHQKAGWNLLYYNFLLGLAVSLVTMVLYASYDLVGRVLGFVIGMAIGAFILFQIRSRFSK